MTPEEIMARHNRACNNPLNLFEAAHEARYGSPIAEDCILGPAWLDMANGLGTQLNGELGRLDGGLLDRELRDIAWTAGFTRDLTERT